MRFQAGGRKSTVDPLSSGAKQVKSNKREGGALKSPGKPPGEKGVLLVDQPGVLEIDLVKERNRILRSSETQGR